MSENDLSSDDSTINMDANGIINMSDVPTIEELCGWAPHPDDVAAANPPLFGDVAAHLATDNPWDGRSDVPLWDACIKVLGSNIPAHRQTIGDCVSHGHGTGLDFKQCIQIARGVSASTFNLPEHECYTEAIYGNMRVGKRMGNNDGAAGIWAVDSLIKDGYPQRRGRPYDGQKAKLWGNSGTPAAIKAEGSDFKLSAYAQVRTLAEGANFLNNGKPITVCSNQGFTMTRNADGICEAQGSWAHCMVCIGLLMVRGERIWIICQSWGKNVPSGPTIKNMPDCSFGVRDTVFQRMLNSRDSYALDTVPGFQVEKLDFFV